MTSLSPLSTEATHLAIRPSSIEENFPCTNCQDITYLALHIIAASGTILGAALMASGSMSIGFTICALSVGLALAIEFFGGSSEQSGSSQTGGAGSVVTSTAPVNRPFHNLPVHFPSPHVIPEFPRLSGCVENPLQHYPVVGGEVYFDGTRINMPDPGAQLRGTGIDRRHLVEELQFQRQIPIEAPSSIELRHMKAFFNKINFTEPNAPCYVFSETGTDTGPGYEKYKVSGRIDLNLFANDLQSLVDRVAYMENPNDRDGFDRPDPETARYFKLIIYKFMQIDDSLIRSNSASYVPNDDPRLDSTSSGYDQNLAARREAQIRAVNLRNQSLVQMIEGLRECHTRVRSEVTDTFRRVFGGASNNLEGDVKKALTELRYSVIQQLGNITPIGQDGRPTGVGLIPENIENYMYYLGPTRGVSEDVYVRTEKQGLERPHPEPEYQFHEEPYEGFNRRYNKDLVIQVVKEGMNGVAGMDTSRQYAFEATRDWFMTHVPEDFNGTADEYCEQHVYEEAENFNYNITDGAVAYFLKTIGVITDEAVAQQYRRRS